jgi:uncharacterized protein DUF3658
MSSISDQDIDSLILSTVGVQWRKVAFIVGRVLKICEKRAPETNRDDIVETIADRVRALVDDGKLDAQGNVSRIRHSEVRLPGADQELERKIHHS